jgi:hypothetical protein
MSYTSGGGMGSNLPIGRNLGAAINDAGSKAGVKEKVCPPLLLLSVLSSSSLIHSQILKVFDQFGSQTPQGLSIQEAIRILQADGLSFEIISRTIQYLTDEGLLYTTIDEDHYKTTESM